jgi:hypothetical protein
MASVHIKHSAPYLAVLLLYGLLFAQASAYFIGIHWTRSFTITLYMIAFFWSVVLLLRQDPRWWKPNYIDLIVILFWCTVGLSLLFSSDYSWVSNKNIQYLPFMAILPYLCGRLISKSEIPILIRAILCLAAVIIILVLADRYIMATYSPIRRPIFGYDHGRLMVGSLIAAALPLACFYNLNFNSGGPKNVTLRVLSYFLPIVLLIMLFSVMARGWLASGLAGALILVAIKNDRTILRRLVLTAILCATAFASHVLFQKFDPNYANFNESQYRNLSFQGGPFNTDSVAIEENSSFNMERCKLLQSTNSISVRSMLYQEAMHMFFAEPLTGVGAGKYGQHSCWVASEAYPHSTVLHVLSELGLFGGLLFMAACIVALTVLLRSKSPTNDGSSNQIYACCLCLLTVFLISDQVYGNYFMASGTWLLIGLAGGALIHSSKPNDS